MKHKTLSERLIWSRERKGWTQVKLIAESGVPQGSVSKIERGDQEHTGKHGTALAVALGIRLEWLNTGLGNPFTESIPDNASPVRHSDAQNNGDVFVRQYRDMRWAAGSGNINEQPSEYEPISFKKTYMERNNLASDSCICCPASGDSMSPTINDGDIMLINLEERDLLSKDGNIFAFAIGEECRVKRVFSTVLGEIRLVSDNPNKAEYPDETVKTTDLNSLLVAGRIRWSGGDK